VEGGGVYGERREGGGEREAQFKRVGGLRGGRE